MQGIASTLATADDREDHPGRPAVARHGVPWTATRTADGFPGPAGPGAGTAAEGAPPPVPAPRRLRGRPLTVGGDWPW